MKEQQEYRAGIYTRISADDGVTDRESNSITTQKQILTRYANEHGFRVVEYYADDGYSGTNFNRPEFKRMMGDIEMGKINLVLTKDLSRLGRNHILTDSIPTLFFRSTMSGISLSGTAWTRCTTITISPRSKMC